MKTIRLLAGACFISVLVLTGCLWGGNYRSTYAMTPDGEIYEVDPYYNDMTVWVSSDEGQRSRIHTILVDTREQVIIDRRNAHSDREFESMARVRYQTANNRISGVLTTEQNHRFKPHQTEFRNWVYGQRERPKGRPTNQHQNEGRGH